ncbi:MAG: DNA polymerase, partial [Butyricicoccaceae bacterium]
MKLMAIDGNSILNRAFYGIRLLTNQEGLYTNAIYGFLSTLFRLQDSYQPDRTVVCFDMRAKTFRHKEYEAYKGTRKGMPEELAVQLPVIKQVLGAMGIPCLEQEGYEADDLLGTVSRQANEHGDLCYVVTGDKDSLQLIGNGTVVLLVTSKGGQTLTTEYTEEVFQEEYGFPPIRMIDLKGLMGDSSDNIPGVPGIGQKTATALLQKFGSVEGVYEHIDDPFIKKGQRAKLLDGRESAEMSLHLATIVRDVPIACDVTALPEPFLDEDELYHLLTHLEFKSFITRLGLTPPEAEEAEREQALEIIDLSDGTALWDALEGAERIFLTVPHGLHALCAVVGEKAYTLTADAVGTQAWHTLLAQLFSGAYPLVMHDGKEVLTALLAEDITPCELSFDTAIGAYLLDPTQAGYDLARTALAYLNRELPEPDYEQEEAFSPLGGAETAKHSMAVCTAAVRDLYEKIAPKIEEQGMHELCYEVELPMINVLAEMQHVGVQTDAAALREFGSTLGGRIEELTQEIYQQAGEEFNINSPKQLGVILFEKLGLPVIKKTKSGYSTNADVLERLRPTHCIVDMILEYRMLTKLNSTYVEGLLKVIQPDGRIRSTFHQTGTATGRLSSSDPNLQNIPVRQELGSQLRK